MKKYSWVLVQTAFSFDNVLYEQCDGVSMGSSLGPVLANIILTEFENVIVKPLIETSVLKFYCRYVDDTIALLYCIKYNMP